MSLKTRLNSLIAVIKTETKALRVMISGTNTGDVSALTTTATNLVAAINEVKTTADGVGLVINDLTTTTTDLWSSTKVDSEITTAVNSILDGAPAALDTLNELAAAIGDDSDYAGSITALLATKAAISTIYIQSELGDPETDLAAIWAAA
jgi:hypothetical protein